MIHKKCKAAAVQWDVKLGNAEANLACVREMLGIAKANRADLAVLPEMWSCGFDNAHLADHARRTPDILAEILKLARQYNMIVAGSMPESQGKNIYNTMYVADRNGTLAGSYRKVHLFSVTGEEKYFASGRSHAICRTSLGDLGLMICYDLRFPELCRTLVLKGATAVIISAQWPRVRIHRWDILAQARAVENQIYLIASNRCGKENNTIFGGHSIIVAPSGEVLAMAEEETCLQYAEIDPERIIEARKIMPSLKERMPEAYEI